MMLLQLFLLCASTNDWIVQALSTNHLDQMLHMYRRVMSKQPEDYTYNIPNQLLHKEYDFIVVGAGAGGATVTNRLTEIPEWTTLLLEAGGDEMGITDIPLFAAHFQFTNYNWGFRAQKQAGACLGLEKQRCPWPRGKGMGGSSILNYMMYVRGHPKDYDNWEQMGNPGWAWRDVLPYFIKSENAKGQFADSPFHGKGGYLNVEDVPYRTPLAQTFVDAGKELDFATIDYNSGELIGFSLLQATLRNGSRCSANKAFLRPVRDRSNLHVAKFSQVTRVLIDPVTKRAYGIEFFRNGRFSSVRARKEVILSAGAIQTPQLLMLSGVGPREHLESFNIPVIHDLPGVGLNLQDHVSTASLAFLINKPVALLEKDLVLNLSVYTRYAYGEGPFTIPGSVEAVGYVRTPAAKTHPSYPDIELIFVAGTLASDDGQVYRRAFGVTDNNYNQVFKSIHGKYAWTIIPMLLQPKSRGWVRLKSKNPFIWPIMSGNYFANESDLSTIVEGIKFSIALSQTKAFQRFDSTINNNSLPACLIYEFGSDDYWRCTARQLTVTIFHQCCTAKMGPEHDNMAVVDPELKVHGIKGLRVVDASVMPQIPAGHTFASTVMIGEKAADLIKQTYRKIRFSKSTYYK